MKEKLYTESPLPPELKSKIISSLKSNNMIQNNSFPKMTTMIAVLALVATFSLGFLSNKFANKPIADLAMSDNKSKYMLILQNTPEFKEDMTHVAEYGQWMEGLVNKGIVASGDELNNEGALITNTGSTADASQISGYFMISAENEDHAKAIAMECPHVKHNGQVILKKVIQH